MAEVAVEKGVEGEDYGALAELNGRETLRLFAEHHQREISPGFLQQLTAETGRLALAKEKKWSYEPATPPAEAGWIVMGTDGTRSPMCEGGWKQVMVGTITLCDKAGEPLETIYIANAPEDGKATFYERMEREVTADKTRYPLAPWSGISDGARLTKLARATIERAVAYMEANEDRMDYPAALAAGYMIGSGVTEAACKTVVKARLCGSGMRWHAESMQQILCLRALRRSTSRGEQFWQKIDRQGC